MAQDLILIVDLGGGEPQLIARSVRGLGVYCEIVDGCGGLLERAASGWIFVGANTPIDKKILDSDVPALALGDASGALLRASGGESGAFVMHSKVLEVRYHPAPIFEGIEDGLRRIERASALNLPDGWTSIATVDDIPIAFSNAGGTRVGLQFMPERNDVDGYQMLSNFLHIICGCESGWTIENYLESAVEGLRNRVGGGVAVCPMTGGVDSAVSAALAYKALGERAICLFIDTGLNSEGKAELFEKVFTKEMNIPIKHISAGERFMLRLEGLLTPEQKRLAVADEFRRIVNEHRLLAGEEAFLVQGTIYSDILNPTEHREAVRRQDDKDGIVTLEPLRALFKNEVRQLGEQLGLPQFIVRSQHYPNAGLAVRCLGEVTQRKIGMLRRADSIFRHAIEESGADKSISQYFATMSDMRARDISGKSGAVIILRAMVTHRDQSASAARLSYEILEPTVDTILREIPGIARVMYDLSPRPPAEVELE